MKISKDEMAQKLVELFPEKEQSLKEHYKDYNELHGHIFFVDEINVPLFKMLQENKTNEIIMKYCSFVEYMWLNGAEYFLHIGEKTRF
mgnify:FL=1